MIREMVAIASLGAIVAVASADEPAYRTFTSQRTAVSYAGVDPAYAKAIARICDTALAGYDTVYGLQMPEGIQVRVSLSPQQRLRLWTDGDSTIFFELSGKRQLAPPAQSGVFNVYGFCHELGHIAIYRRMSSMMGLPDGVGEGWAHYFGSMICGYVWDKLGERAWPQPHNYHEQGGPGRFERQVAAFDDARANPEDRAAYLLYRVEQRYGRRALGKAMESALAAHPRGTDLVRLFRNELVEVTRDPKAADLFPPSLLEARATFDGGAPDFGSLASFRGMKVKRDATGLLLHYDDGTMQSKRSIGGAGEIVQFRMPPGKWRLDAVLLFGSRYGDVAPPQRDFSIFICDRLMNVVAEIRKPYSLFERGDEKWVVMRFEPIEAPSAFHICVSFDATANEGVYVGQDTAKPSGHSRVGLPYSRIGPFLQDADWMIRAHITPADKVNLEAFAAGWGRAFDY